MLKLTGLRAVRLTGREGAYTTAPAVIGGVSPLIFAAPGKYLSAAKRGLSGPPALRCEPNTGLENVNVPGVWPGAGGKEFSGDIPAGSNGAYAAAEAAETCFPNNGDVDLSLFLAGEQDSRTFESEP
jgi:hypothetical protein